MAKSRRFAVAVARSGMNCSFNRIMQRKDFSLFLFCGLPASWTDCVFWGSGLIQSFVTLNPQKGISYDASIYFLGLTVRPAV